MRWPTSRAPISGGSGSSPASPSAPSRSGQLLLALVDVSERGGIAIEALGVVAAVAALAIVVLVGRREDPS